MPIYKVNGETYDIPASKQEAFEKRYPDASVSYINAGDTYEIPLNKRDAFLKRYPDAYLTSLEVPSTEQPKAAYSPTHNYGDGSDTNARVRMFNDKPNPPLNTVRGFGKAAAQSARGLGAGVQNLWGEFTNIFTGSSRDDANALAEFDRMMSEGIDVNDATEGAWTHLGRELRTGALELLPGWMIKGWKQNVHDQAEKMKVLGNIRDVLSETGGDVGKARALLQQRAKDQSYGDRQMQAAAETMGEMKPTEGFGAWLGENMVQMIPSASALLVGAITRSPAAAKAIGGLGIGAMTAATSGQSMYEARQAGASDYETRKTGVVDGMIEVITEKIPFDRYTKRIVGKAKKEVAEQMARALSDKNSPAREELQDLLTRANRLLGGKLFSKKTAQEYIADIMAEGASEFTAEALQTMSSIIYEEPENYPEFSEIMSNGFQGLLAGAFMGSVLGGSSLALGSQQNKQRRKEQGFVKIGLIDNGDNGMDIGEIAAYDPERQMFTITDGINSYEVGRNKIKQTFDYTYEEFESARYRQLEDEAIDNGTVTDGQMSASEQRLNKERGRFDVLLSNSGLSDEEKADVFASIERGDIPALPEQSDLSLWKAAESYADAYERYADIRKARDRKVISERSELSSAIEKKVGKFWQDETETVMDNGFSAVEPKMVEFGTLADGRNVYIISGVNEDGEVAAVTEDGERLFVNHAMMPNGTRIMSLDEYLDERLAQQRSVAEQERMSTENAERVNDVRQQVSLGMEVNLGTQEAPIMGTVLEVMPANDGVLVQTEQGVAQLSWEKVADVLNVGTASMTDLEIAAKDAADILESENAWKEVTARTEQEVALASSAEEVAAVASEDAEPLPLKQDGSVDQTTLWNKSPERWARWNDEQRQDGGVNSINYINNALAKAQKDLDSAVKAYDKETDFEAREAMEEGIRAKQERVARLSALQQSYLPENAQEQAAAQVAQETAGVQSPATQAEPSQTAQALPAPEQTIYDLFSDESLSEDEIEAYIDANVAGSQSDLDKHLNKAPKMGRDMEKYKADKAKHEEKTRELTAIRDHWRQVRAYLNPSTVEMDAEPQNALEAASKELTRKDGISLLPESFRHHTGYGRGEQVAFLSILRKKENGGMTLEAAGERLMADYPEFFDQNDPNAGLNAILEVLQSAASSSDLYNYINNAREDVARQGADVVRSAVIQQVEETKNRLTDANGTETTQISDLSVSEESSISVSERSLNGHQSDGSDIVPTPSDESSESKDSSNPAISNESEENVDGFTSTLDEDMPDFESMSDEEVKRMAIEAVVPETERQRFQDEKRNTLKDRIREWEQRLGAKVKVMDSIDDVTNSQAKAQIEKGGEVWGWFETSTGEVCIYLPDFMSLSTSAALSEIDKTYIHEIVSHKGLRGLLGEDAYGELCDMVWEAMTEEEQQSWMQYPGVNGNTRAAADEYIAHFAESVEYNQTIWDKIVKFIKDLFASKDVAISISDEGLTELLRASYDKLVSEAPARMEPEKISLNDYLGRLGLSSPISDYMDDKLRNPHGLSESQRNQLEKEAKAAADDYHARRNAAIDEYNRMVAEGKIIPPTQIDRLIATANGHPDNEATQAARRSLEKRGYDWQSGQKKSTEVKSEPEKASKTIKAEKAKDEKIEDFGEKIGGARKDAARAKIRDSVKLTTKDLVELKDPDKILSRKNIIKYYSEGVMTFEDAVKLLAMNMAVRGRDTINRGVAMKKYRNLAMAWESGAELIVEITDEDVQDRMNEYSERMRQAPDIEKKTREGLELFVLKLYNDYKATYEALNYPEVYRNIKSAYIRYGEHDGKYWVVDGPNAYRGYPFPTLEQAIAKMVKLYPEQTVAKKPSESKKDGEKSSSIHVTKDRAGYYRIKSRNIPGEIYLSGKLYSKKDAEAYLAENLDKLVERENRLLEALLGSNIGMVEREGLDYRKGKDVTPKDFLDTFGFRGVEFGNWVPQVERQAYLNKTYDAIMDFCRIVGISPKAFSLGGRLGLAFGSRGKSRALAHYEPMKEVINLTRMKGAGSLAHEWFHALDNYLAKQRSGNTSDMTTDNKPAVRQEVTDAFNAFVSAMNRLAYTRRSNRAGQYWGEVWERAARLFESYIYNELGGQNIVSPLLVKKDTLYVDHGEFSDDAWPYPSAEENEQMKPYFDRLFSTLQEQVEEDGSVTLFRAKDAGRKQAQFDIINETNPMTDDYHVGIRKVEDIKTFDEVMETARRESEEGGWPELASYPDIENSLLEEALETRRIVIYSSHPISNGKFVTPSYIQADEYSGMTGEVYSKEVSVDDIAWINTDEGQYASLNDATDRYNDTPDEDIRFRTTEIIPEVREEMAEIKESAERAGTYLKAPNGADTNLTAEQWALVRTKAFKAWFGDWEKAARIQKLRNSEPVMMDGNEHEGKYELNRESAQRYILDELRDTYIIADTNERIKIVKRGAKKVTSHSMGNDVHMRSIAIIPEIIKSAIFITEMSADKADAQYDSYRYYVCGLEYAGESYTVKMTVGVKNGDYYYDHTLTDIEKGKLLDMIESQQGVSREGFTPTGNESDPSYALSDIKDKKLVSILQNNASKVVDANGEPMVVYHGTDKDFNVFDIHVDPHKSFTWKIAHFGTKEQAEDILRTSKGAQRLMEVFLNIRNPYRISDQEDNDSWRYAAKQAANGMFADQNGVKADGLVYLNEYEGKVPADSYAVWNPSQIKSATDNTGEFSADNNDIRFRTRYDVNTNPTEAQKKAGNYKMGHIRLDGYNITIENPKGSVRKGTDSKGNAWENTLNNDYGYIRGTEGVDGDHIDVYLSDNPSEGNVFVIDQVNPQTREFDEHKVMYGFNSAEEAREAYLANFSEGWNGLGTITEVSKDEFKKWIDSSHRKTKPFSEYKSVRANEMQTTDDSGLRYRVVTDQETLDRLDSEPTIKVYRAMQLIDGKLYPPMSAKVDGELRQPIELGQWEEAEERPDLVDEKGRFKLDKGNKSSLKARYNPYFHTSPTPLNDQFSSAQTRPELVTVEVEVPESELTSGYKAEKAKDAVGKLEWKAGVVQSKLSGTRTVILSRWDKPVRIVPDSEVADVIVDMFEGKDITMPSNVVTPSLRAELEKRGVPFIETDNQGNPIEETRFRSTGTPTEDVVARGLELSRQDAARLAGDIYSIMPADIRKRVSAEALNNGMDLQKTIFQISARLAEKDSLSDEETAFAKSVADILEQRLLDDGVEMTRPLATSEALWMLWRNSNPVGEDDVFGAARRAVVADNLGMSTRFRAADKRNDSDNRSKQFREATASAAADAYNRSVSFWKNRLKESYVDNMDSVNILVEAIEKASGKAAQGWEDIRLTMNQLSSKGLSAMEKFIRDYLHPMWDAVEAIMKKMDIDKADVERYIMLESGLERNEVFAKRDAKAKHQDEYDKQIRSIEGMEVTDEEKAALKVKAKNTLDRRLAAVDAGTDATYKKMRERDYGAVMAQFAEYAPIKDQSAYGSLEEYNRAKLNSRRLKYSTVEEAESAAWEEIKAFRQKAGEELIDNLWKRINAATKATLKQQYEANMLSKAQYDHIRGMFKYYVPMRGFADNTAEDMYSYYANGQNDFAAPVLKAKGRTTMAESPLGHIGAMASSGIAQGMKNEAKLALYYFVLNRPNDLVSVDKTWYVDTGRADEEGKAIFEAKYPPMTGALSEEKARADYEKWQNEMKELEKQGKAVRGSRKLDLKNSVIHITPSSAKEHTITVKVGGEEITMFINGNPRAAQAVNGLLNIEASDKFEGMRKYLRFLSSVNTSFNPEFWMTNLQRDMLFTAMAISSKEDAQYNKAFRENYWKAWKAVTMVRKDKNGTLGDSHVEQLFKEFVENGGPTGYTKVIGNEEWEKTMNKYLSRKDRPKVESIRKAFDALQSFSEGIEQVSRFAAYMTSREMGRSVQQSISDAKEVTVNFNRKGSGQEITKEEADKLTDENGQPLSELSKFCIRMISKISPYGRGFLMFFNASVQGLNSFVRLTKNNPKAMSIWASGYLMLGILNASLHAMLDDDDEYLDIPDYERRTSLLLGGNGAYFKWALPQEARAFYALGDLFVNRTLDRMPHQNVVWEATKILFDVAPLNPTEGVAGVLPPFFATAVELWTNKDYKGAKIRKDMAYLSDEAKKGVPEYTKTFSGTSEVAVALSRAINWLSGGDYATSGYLDGFLTNPAVMQHVVESQLGGTLRTINKALDTIWNIGGLAVGAEDAEFTVRNTPFLNRLLTINDERYRNSHTTDLYKHYKGVAANAKRREKEYSAAHDSENLNSLRSSEDYAVFQIYQRHKKVLDMYDKQLKLARNEQERRLIMQRQDAERKRMIEEISRL